MNIFEWLRDRRKRRTMRACECPEPQCEDREDAAYTANFEQVAQRERTQIEEIRARLDSAEAQLNAAMSNRETV